MTATLKEQIEEFRDSALENLENILAGKGHTPPPEFYVKMSCAEGMTFHADVCRLALIGLEVERHCTKQSLAEDVRIPAEAKLDIAATMNLRTAAEIHGN